MLRAALLSAPDVTYTDLPAVAELYAQFSTVLAGFAFAGLISVVLVPAVSPQPGREMLFAVKPLAATLVSMSLTSIVYSMLGGEVYMGPRTTSLFPIAAVPLSFSSVLILQSLIILFVGIERDSPRRLESLRAAAMTLRATVPVVSAVFILAVYSRLRDHFYEPGNAAGQYGTADVAFWVLCGGPLAFCLFTVTAHTVARHWLRGAMRSWPRKVARIFRGPADTHDVADKYVAQVVCRLALIGTIVCLALVSAVRAVLDPELALPIQIELAVTAGLAWFYIPLVVSAMTYGRYDDPENSGESRPPLGIEIRETDPRHGRSDSSELN